MHIRSQLEAFENGVNSLIGKLLFSTPFSHCIMKDRWVCQFPYRETSLFYSIKSTPRRKKRSVSIPLSGNFSFLPVEGEKIELEVESRVNSLIGKLLFSTGTKGMLLVFPLELCQFPYRETSLFYFTIMMTREMMETGVNSLIGKLLFSTWKNRRSLTRRRTCQFPYRETSLFYVSVNLITDKQMAVSIPLSGNFSFLRLKERFRSNDREAVSIPLSGNFSFLLIEVVMYL